jgi:hypothetical protein
MEIKIYYSTIDRFSESRKYRSLAGATRYAHRRVGPNAEISSTFGYAVSEDGIGKITVSGDANIYEVMGRAREL